MEHIISIISFALVVTITPGPNTLMAMSNGLRYGYKGTARFLAGMSCGFLLVMVLTGSLGKILVDLMPRVQAVLVWLSALYLVYLAIRIWRSSPVVEEGSADSLENSFRSGFIMQFLNGKLIMFGLSIFSLLIIPLGNGYWRTIAFAPLITLVGFLSASVWALAGDIFQKFLRRQARLVNVVMALALVAVAVSGVVR